MHLRSYFASVCLLAVATEASVRRDFNLEATMLENARARANTMNVHPDKIPNWMGGFYDDYTPESSKRSERHEQRHHRQEYEVDAEPTH